MTKRIRTHTNPLAFPEPIPRSNWTSKLKEGQPLIVDLGCGKCEFLIQNAKKYAENNYVGIEVRFLMTEEVNKRIKNLKNIICLHGNASISLKSLFRENEVSEFYINFPDPWFKMKHKKRLILKEDVVDDLFFTLKKEGKIYLMSDVEVIFEEFCNLLKTKFKKVRAKKPEFESYWERWHNKKGKSIYRACFKKSS